MLLREHVQAGVSSMEYAAVLVQGAGTYAVESVISSIVPKKLVIFANGAYGDRIATMAKYSNTETVLIRTSEEFPVSLETVEEVQIILGCMFLHG